MGCRRTADQGELRRYALVNGRVVRDDARRRPGRGAYACDDDACVERATQRRAWGRAFRAAVSETPE